MTAPLSSLSTLSDDVGQPYSRSRCWRRTLRTVYRWHSSAASGGKPTRQRRADCYGIMDVSQYTAQISSVTGMFTGIIAAIAGISLLVGGIGVMNIMLVSVTERTREIGIRKALGAKTGSITFQFLIEAGTLTLIGGVIGIVLGLWGGYGISSLMGMEGYVAPSTVVYIALFSIAIGIFFGIYPARKAARLSPIEALRTE
ncbi:MAG: ABC transporter permease [Ruthenibacterium lactatiformans]